MSFVKTTTYREMSFSPETPVENSYTYIQVSKVHEHCEKFQDEVLRCRTIGVLDSHNGHYYLQDISQQKGVSSKKVLISLVYLSTPPQSTTIPYPVQVFGYLQWKQQPVLYVTVLQTIRLPIALMMNNLMTSTQKNHLAKS